MPVSCHMPCCASLRCLCILSVPTSTCRRAQAGVLLTASSSARALLVPLPLTMPTSTKPDELTNAQVHLLMQGAQKVVDDSFSPVDHLPRSIYQFLAPIADSTCQGMFSCLCVVAGALPALCNGASVQLWSQKPTPLACVMIQVAPPQKGKSRLWQVVEEMLDTCDDVVSEMAQQVADRAPPPERDANHDGGKKIGRELSCCYIPGCHVADSGLLCMHATWSGPKSRLR